MDVLHTDDAGLEWHYLCRIVCCTIEPALKVRLMISRLRRMSMPRSICWQEMLHLKCGLPAKMVVPVNWAFHAVFHSGRYSISPFRNPDASWQTNSCRFFFAMHCVEVVFFPSSGFPSCSANPCRCTRMLDPVSGSHCLAVLAVYRRLADLCHCSHHRCLSDLDLAQLKRFLRNDACSKAARRSALASLVVWSVEPCSSGQSRGLCYLQPKCLLHSNS